MTAAVLIIGGLAIVVALIGRIAIGRERARTFMAGARYALERPTEPPTHASEEEGAA